MPSFDYPNIKNVPDDGVSAFDYRDWAYRVCRTAPARSKTDSDVIPPRLYSLALEAKLYGLSPIAAIVAARAMTTHIYGEDAQEFNLLLVGDPRDYARVMEIANRHVKQTRSLSSDDSRLQCGIRASLLSNAGHGEWYKYLSVHPEPQPYLGECIKFRTQGGEMYGYPDPPEIISRLTVDGSDDSVDLKMNELSDHVDVFLVLDNGRALFKRNDTGTRLHEMTSAVPYFKELYQTVGREIKAATQLASICAVLTDYERRGGAECAKMMLVGDDKSIDIALLLALMTRNTHYPAYISTKVN